MGDDECDGGDYNTEKCGWDANDCTYFNDLYPDCDKEYFLWLNDKECDEIYRNEDCGWDHGDCPAVSSTSSPTPNPTATPGVGWDGWMQVVVSSDDGTIQFCLDQEPNSVRVILNKKCDINRKSQQWKHTPDGAIMNRNSLECLEMKSSFEVVQSERNGIQMEECNAEDAGQKFVFSPIKKTISNVAFDRLVATEQCDKRDNVPITHALETFCSLSWEVSC